MKFNLYQTKKQTRQFAIVLRLSGILLIFFIVLNGLLPVGGQIATGGSYTLEQAVVANGGGTSTGNTYSISGTTGQSVAGQMATTAPFSVHAGFWNPTPFSTTAAGVSVSGRVQTASGRGIRNARLTLTSAGGATWTTLTGIFGFFNFDDVTVSDTYILSISAKRFRFAQPVQILTIRDYERLFNDLFCRYRQKCLRRATGLGKDTRL